MAQKRVLVACGTGIATSTVVVNKLMEMFEKRGLNIKVDQCKASEAPSKAASYDLIVTTTPLSDIPANVPVLRSISFITGIGIDKDIDTIVQKLGV